MSLRLTVLGGAVLAGAALLSGSYALLQASSEAMEAVRSRLTACALPGLRCAPPDVFLHQRAIGAPPDRAFGLPDPDTLVSSAWVRMADGPVRIELPPVEARFFALQVLDSADRPVRLLSSRTGGAEGGPVRITPAEAGTEWVWIVARFAVGGESDTPAVHALQNALRVTRERGQQ